jgi:hypothetical protein
MRRQQGGKRELARDIAQGARMTNEGKSNRRGEELSERSRQESDNEIAKDLEQEPNFLPYDFP